MVVWKCSPMFPEVPPLTEPTNVVAKLLVKASLVPVRVTVVMVKATE